jgi:hypothetical protein
MIDAQEGDPEVIRARRFLFWWVAEDLSRPVPMVWWGGRISTATFGFVYPKYIALRREHAIEKAVRYGTAE